MKTIQFRQHESSLGMGAPIVVLIAYFGASVVGLIPGLGSLAFLVPLILYFTEKDSKLVKFSAMQSFLFSVTFIGILLLLWILSITIGVGSFISGGLGITTGIIAVAGIVTIVFSILSFIIAILAVLKGFNYEALVFPVVGKWTLNITKIETSEEQDDEEY